MTAMPVVSADRRYVRLTVSPFFSTIDGFDQFPVPAAVAGGGFGGFGGLGLGGNGGGGGGGAGMRSVPPAGPVVRGQAAANHAGRGGGRVRVASAPPAAQAPRDLVAPNVAAQIARQRAVAGRSAVPKATPTMPPRPTTYRPGDPYAGIGPSGFESGGSGRYASPYSPGSVGRGMMTGGLAPR